MAAGAGAAALVAPLASADSANESAANELTVTVTGSPVPGQNGTHRLTCEPAGGNHPDPAGACRALASQADPFAPVPANQMCTQIYGGPATAQVTGRWRGRPVDAAFRRTDGCQTSRWDRLVPLLPAQ